MNTTYLNIENVATQEDLYQSLVNAIEPLLNEEKFRRTPLEKAFEEKIQPALTEYTNSTLSAQNTAQKRLAPKKAKLDKEIEALKARMMKIVDKKVSEYDKHKAIVQTWFDDATKPALAKYEATIAADKAQLDADLQVIVAEVAEKIKPINEEYQRLAKEMDLEVPVTPYDGPPETREIPDEEYVALSQELMS